MDISLREILGIHSNDNISGNNVAFNLSHNDSFYHPEGNCSNCGVISDVEFIVKGVLNPIIGVCGILGNVLNLTILTWRCNKREVDVLERGALLGLIALAVSDLFFCLGILPGAASYYSQTVFYSRNFEYCYKVYGVYYQDVFIKISTWLTVVIGTARYVAICHPLKARIFTGLFATKVAIVDTYIVWILLMIPLLWSYDIQEYDYNDHKVYIVDLGYYQTNAPFKLSFTYFWAITGYFIPVSILTFCNVNLIRALQQSKRWRECSARSAPSGRDANVRITSTLVALIVMFLVLVSPSELLHFYFDAIGSDPGPSFELWVLCTNLLQLMNFAFHFALYCAVNGTFRRTLFKIFHVALRKLKCREPKRIEMKRRRSFNMTRNLSRTKSGETNVYQLQDHLSHCVK